MSNVSFTPCGNQYQKTSTGKKVGVTTGAIAGGVGLAIGAIVDKVRNNNRRAAADSASNK